MKLSFSSWLFCSYPGWVPTRSLEDAIDAFAEAGYDGIEIGAAAPHGYPPYLDAQRRRDLLGHLAARQMEVSALCPAIGGAAGYNPVSPEQVERDAGLEYMRECLELAHDLQCENLIWLSGWTRYGQTHRDAWAYAVEALQRTAEAARPLGVRLLVEPTPEVANVLEHAGDSLRIMDEAGAGPDVASVMLDTIHMFYRGDDVRAQIREAGDRLGYVHLADDGRTVPGTHHDFRSVIDECKLVGYDGWLSLEIGFAGRDPDPDGIARQAFEYVTSVLDPQDTRLASWRRASAGR